MRFSIPSASYIATNSARTGGAESDIPRGADNNFTIRFTFTINAVKYFPRHTL